MSDLTPHNIITDLPLNNENVFYRTLYRNFDIIRNFLGGTVELGEETFTGSFTTHSGETVTVKNGVITKVE